MEKRWWPTGTSYWLVGESDVWVVGRASRPGRGEFFLSLPARSSITQGLPCLNGSALVVVVDDGPGGAEVVMKEWSKVQAPTKKLGGLYHAVLRWRASKTKDVVGKLSSQKALRRRKLAAATCETAVPKYSRKQIDKKYTMQESTEQSCRREEVL